MKKLLIFFILLYTMLPAGQVMAVSLFISPPSLTIGVGEAANVDLVVSGLGDFAEPSLGAFDLDIIFDETVLTFDSVGFGTFLGDESLGEAITFVGTGSAGGVRLLEVSLLSIAELDALQGGRMPPGEFSLASLMFTGSNFGFSELALENVVLSDAAGSVIPDPTIGNGRVDVVPEPANLLLVGVGMAGMGLFRWRRFRN